MNEFYDNDRNTENYFFGRKCQNLNSEQEGENVLTLF